MIGSWFWGIASSKTLPRKGAWFKRHPTYSIGKKRLQIYDNVRPIVCRAFIFQISNKLQTSAWVSEDINTKSRRDALISVGVREVRLECLSLVSSFRQLLKVLQPARLSSLIGWRSRCVQSFMLVGRVGLNPSNRATVAIRSDVRDVHDFSLATDRTPPP